VPERAGPGPMDGSTVLWMYHSHTDEERDIYAGLLGPMIIAKRGAMRPSGRPADVDREVVMAFYIGQEGRSWYADRNMPFRAQLAAQGPQALGPLSRPSGAVPFWFKPSINGFTHGNLPVESVTMRKGERVRWYVFASTNEFDFHSPHWHGNTVLVHGRREDVTTLLPMEMMIADMVPDNVGTWLFHCHVADHFLGGMSLRYRVVETKEAMSGTSENDLGRR
jgi:FtsP/CotA-like multicopper oxidase with cupredoxin domain